MTTPPGLDVCRNFHECEYDCFLCVLVIGFAILCCMVLSVCNDGCCDVLLL